MTGANNSLLMKEQNRQKVLSLIREKEQSRAQISRATGLSRAAVTLIVEGLIKEGLIIEGESVKSDTGRRPTMLKLHPDAYIAIGVDVSRDKLCVSYTDFTSKTVYENTVALGDDADSSVNALCDSIKSELRDRFADKKILGVGICCPGPVDTINGVILNPPGLESFHNYNIKQAVEQRLNLPVTVQKDTNALAIAEKNAGKLDGDTLFLLADHGLGCGVIKDGKLLTAKGGMGCEIGHVTLKYDGEKCRCGNVGCAELYVSVPALLEKAQKTLGRSIELCELVKMADCGEQKAKSLMDEYSAMLATVCVGAVNLFEPEYIVLGGELKRASGVISKAIERRIAESRLSRGSGQVLVSGSILGENARACAAAELVIEDYFLGRIKPC